MKDELKRYGLFGLKSKDKFIPDEYKFGNIEARYQLLAGLIDTDGYYDNNIHYYYTNSEQLKDDVVFICGSLGIKTNVHIKKVKKYEIPETRKLGKEEKEMPEPAKKIFIILFLFAVRMKKYLLN